MLPPEPLILDDWSRELYDHFVPPSHPLRRIDEAIDFSFILPLVAHRYNPEIGCPAKHPEMMWRLLFAQYYLNLSDEKVCLQAYTDLALRLFLRLGWEETPPHPTTLQKFRAERMMEKGEIELYLKIHFELLKQAEEAGLLKKEERQIFDTSHVRSNTRIVSIPQLLLQARNKVIKEVKKIDEEYGAELEAQADADRQAYQEERQKRIEERAPRRTKEEKANAAAKIVAKTLVDVRERIDKGQIEATERLHLWLAVLEKVIKDREKDAEERIVSVHDLEARKGKKGFGAWDGRKLGINIQEESRFITAAQMVAANRNDCELVIPLLDQQKAGIDMTPKELSADAAADTGVVRTALRDRHILGHIPITPETNSKGMDLFKVKDFVYDPEHKQMLCPAGETTKSCYYDTALSRDGYQFHFRMYSCRKCELRPKCCRTSKLIYHGRQVYVSKHWLAYAEARKHNQSAAYVVA
ncbi:MAG: transposase, partial [Chloroflexi bacterium]|nr:transposase [Chloroflexota bacterium]